LLILCWNRIPNTPLGWWSQGDILPDIFGIVMDYENP
jgi:hypothetical protein